MAELMSELVHNVPEFTVGGLSGALKQTVEETFGRVRVRGEISGFKPHSSGHLYFTLKDSEAVLDAACFRQNARRLGVAPEDGLEVIATGRLTTYPQRSKYQLIVENLELAGKGALLALIEERKKKLAAEGLFDVARKQALPYLPNVIGVVTSPTGAVIRDILHRLAERFPRHVLVWPVAVQGNGAAEQVAAAIDGFNRLEPGGDPPRPDLLIVARGGGSVEDLMAFNEEIVVRAAANSRIPLISAVGHETDTTLIDFASARRAPTPTAAAEMAVPVRAELLARLFDAARRLVSGLDRGLSERRLALDGLRRGLGDPRRLIEAASQRLDDRTERFDQAMRGRLAEARGRLALFAARLPSPQAQVLLSRRQLESETRALDAAFAARLRAERQILRQNGEAVAALSARLERVARQGLATKRDRLASLSRTLDAISYAKTLERGFAVVRGAGGEVVMEVASARKQTALEIEFHDGRLKLGGAPAKGKAPKESGGQGSLL